MVTAQKVLRISRKTNLSNPAVVCGTFRAIFGAIAIEQGYSYDAGCSWWWQGKSYANPFFGMFGYGGPISSMHLARHTIVSSKTKNSKKVYTLHLRRDALLSSSSSDKSWQAPGGLRDPSKNEMKLSPVGSFTKTYTGSILIAVNPFQRLPDLYGKDLMQQYKVVALHELSPHPFAIADSAYRKMINERISQSILLNKACLIWALKLQMG